MFFYYLMQIDPAKIAGESQVLWGAIAVIITLCGVVAFLGKRLISKSDEFIKQHQDLLKETLITLNNVDHSLQTIAQESPRMSTEIREKITAEATTTRGLVITQIEKLETKLK